MVNPQTGSVAVTWTVAPGADGYVISRTPDADPTETTRIAAITDGNATSFTDTTADTTISYTYTVIPYYTPNPPPTDDGSGTGAPETYDDYTGKVGAFSSGTLIPAPDGTYSTTLTWSYQGSVTGFEIEEIDPTIPGSNYVLIDGDPTKVNGRSYPLSGLQPGYTYSVRIRADNADGTVSGYQTLSITAPTASQPDTNDLPPPLVTDFQGSPGNVVWYGSATVFPASGYGVAVSAKMNSDTLGIEPAWVAFSQSGPLAPSGAIPMGGMIGLTSDATFTVQFTTGCNDASSPDFGHTSQPVDYTVTTGGAPLPTFSLTAGKPAANGLTTFSWTQPGNIGGDVYLYELITKNGKETAQPLYSGGYFQLGAGSLSWRLPPGKHTIFAIYEGSGTVNGQVAAGDSPYSNNVEVNVPPNRPPNAPQSVSGAYITGTNGSPGYVQIHWTNSSNNETQFDIQRSSNGPAGPWTTLKSVSADPTTGYNDKTMTDLGPWTYRVRAVNSAGNSAWTLMTAPVDPIGGPEVGGHLERIRTDLLGWYDRLNAGQQTTFDNEWIWTTGGAITGGNTTAKNAGNWDIPQLRARGVVTARNDGILPNGWYTVTVLGNVYRANAVNYWLYGCIASLLGADTDEVMNLIEFRDQYYPQIYTAHEAWFMAGYTNNLLFPSSYVDRKRDPTYTALQNVSGAVPADDPGPIGYHAGVKPVMTGTRYG